MTIENQNQILTETTPALINNNIYAYTPVEIYLDNVYMRIIGMEPDEEKDLWNELSFKVEVFGQQQVYYRHLFNRKTKKAYAGLFTRVTEFLKEREIPYNLHDERANSLEKANFSLVQYIDEEQTIELKLRPYQQEIVDNANPRTIIQACTGAGKRLTLSTNILTPNGFTELRNIHVGDIIYDKNGQKTKVLGEYNQAKSEVYEIEFNDGTVVECDKEHLWEYTTNNRIINNSPHKINTLEYIINNEELKKHRKYNLSIPVCKPVQFDKKPLPVDPYILGLLLGDGCWTSSAISFINTEEDLINKLKIYINSINGELVLHKGTIQYNCVFNKTKSFFRDYINNTFNHCNSYNKFIPELYKLSSVEDRIAIIRGLVDTDGSINSKGHIRWSTVSKTLAEDFQFIVRSLGYRCSINTCDRTGRGKGLSYTIYIRNCDDLLFSSKKHIERFQNRSIHKRHHYEYMKIVDIRKTDRIEEMKCLMVDSPTHTYLCKDFVVTHNTLILAALIAKFNVKPVCVFADKVGLCTQLKNEFEKFLGVEVGLVGDGIEEYKDITVISLQSAKEDYIKNASMIMFDECLSADQRILMGDGVTYKTIKELVDNNVNETVMSFNHETNNFEPKSIISCSKIPLNDKKMMRLTIRKDDGTVEILECTNNHKIWIKEKQQYVKAEELILGQTIMSLQLIKGKIENIEYIDDTEYVYDIGIKDNHNFFANNILVHNCHHIPSATAVDVANKCPNAFYRIGVSATPWRDAGDDLLIEAVLEKRASNTDVSASKLINLGYLIKPSIYFVPVHDVFKGKNYQDLYNNAVTNNVNRNKIITKIATQMNKFGKHIIILYKIIKHGEILRDMIVKAIGEETFTSVTVTNPKTGKSSLIRVSNVEILSGSDKSMKRAAVMQAVKEGKCKILLASTIADEGLDLPILDTLILAGGGKSSTRAFQRVGRVLRLSEGKSKAVVFDFDDQTPILHRHAKVRKKLYETEPEWEISTFNVVP